MLKIIDDNKYGVDFILIGKIMQYEVTIRLIYNMRCIGVRRGGTNLFCGLMNMPPPAVRYIDDNILLKSQQKICDDYEKCCTGISSVNDSDEDDISVSCDGPWTRCGFSSLYDISTVVSIGTGKVLDAQVLYYIFH